MKHGVRYWLASGWGVMTLAMAIRALASDDTHPCAAVAEPDERLACYDAAYSRPAAAPAPEQADDAVPAIANNEFGLSEAELRERDPERARAVLQSIEARVVAQRRRADGAIEITLDNGQTWLQLERTRSLRVRDGDRVTIRRAALGSFLLVTPARALIRVRRIT